MRRPRRRDESREVHLYPQIRTCPACQRLLKERYHKRRFIVRLTEQLNVVSHFLECPTPNCSLREAVHRPEQETLLALRGYTFGLDVVALVGELRYGRKRAIPEIHAELTGAGVSICEREVTLLAEVYLALVTTSASADPSSVEAMKAAGGIVLAIDGVQPEKGNETLYLLRDLQSGRTLVARNLRSSSTQEIAKLIEEVKALGVPILGVISDKQDSICKAIEQCLPKVPHQICQYHFLRDVAQPVADADRHLKKELKKKVRGIKAVEDSIEQMGESAEAQLAKGYTEAIRVVMRQEGKYPLDPAGITLYTKLTKIEASIERVQARTPSKLLARLLRILAVLTTFEESFRRVASAYEWIWKIAQVLEVEGVTAPTARRRLLKYVGGLDGGKDEEVAGWVGHIQKLTASFAPKLFEYVKQPLLPKTNNELELFIGSLKTGRRKATGRKDTTEFILREGRFVAILYGLPSGSSDLAALAAVDFAVFRTTLDALRRREARSRAWRARRDLDAYLLELEQSTPPPE